jgi:hypothetical protein
MTRRWALILSLLLGAADASAQDPTVAPVDPWVPPTVRKSAVAKTAPTKGPELRAEIEQRLRAPFDAAARDGVLTREQAAAAGLGLIVQNFDSIDRGGRGAIRFEDYKRFLKERGAQLD